METIVPIWKDRSLQCFENKLVDELEVNAMVKFLVVSSPSAPIFNAFQGIQVPQLNAIAAR